MKIKKNNTLEMKVNWVTYLPILLQAINEGDVEAHTFALGELCRMAKVADTKLKLKLSGVKNGKERVR